MTQKKAATPRVRLSGPPDTSPVVTRGPILRPGQSGATLRIQGDVQKLQARLNGVEEKIKASEGEQERLAYEMSTVSNADARKKELKIDRLDKVIADLKKQRVRTAQALKGAKQQLADQREAEARAKRDALVAHTKQVIVTELKHLPGLAKRDLVGYDREDRSMERLHGAIHGRLPEQDDRQVAVLKRQIENYSKALLAIDEGRMLIRPDDTVCTFMSQLSQRLAVAENVTVLEGAA
ncbi:MAG: hypothetical protein ACFCUR_06190 [Rhodomicrobiaceae bacterium]